MTPQAGRFTKRAVLAATLAALFMVVLSPTASAHSYFVLSDPPDGSILEHAPSRVILQFSAPVSANFTNIQLVETGGARYSPTSVQTSPGHQNIVEVDLPAVPNGSYRLSFSTRDAVDLHATTGSIVFGVGVAPPSTSAIPTPLPPQPSEVLLRWLALAGLSALLGGLAVAFLVIGGLPVEAAVRARLQRSVLGLASAGAGLVLAGETGLLAVQASSLGPVLPSIGRLLTGSEYGTRWLVIVVIVAGLTPLLAALWSTSRRREVASLVHEFRRQRLWALLTNQVRVVFLSLALTVAMAFSGHVAGATGTSIGGVTLLALHIGAMGAWAGGLVALSLALLTLRRVTGRMERAGVLALALRFGPIAAVSFAILGVTGLLLSGMQVASLTALLSTQYGVVLLAKVGLIGVVGLFGLRHALWTWRGLARSKAPVGRFPARLPLTIALEAVGAVGVVLLAAMLGASAPAVGTQFKPPESGATITQLTRQQDEMLITLSVKPNRSGPNLVSARLVDTRWPAPAPVQDVTVLVRRPDDPQGQLLATTASGPSYDAGTVQLSAGDATFTVTVVRQGLGASVITVPWRVNALDVRRAPVVISNQPLAPAVDLAAVLMLALALLVIGAGLVRYLRARRAVPLRALEPTRVHSGRDHQVASHRYSALSSASRRRPGMGPYHPGARAWVRRRSRLR
ncbi:MAG TPA: copper resistance protein CopC [Candidatus Dormibacteraeota bacterium]